MLHAKNSLDFVTRVLMVLVKKTRKTLPYKWINSIKYKLLLTVSKILLNIRKTW